MTEKGDYVELFVREVLPESESKAIVVVDLWEGELRVGDKIRRVRKSDGTLGQDGLQVTVDKIIAYDREVSSLTAGFAGGLVLSGELDLEIREGDALLV